MDWSQLLNSSRLGEPTPTAHSSEVRSEFDRDADRVMFSSPFRRLSRKTQVHPLAANDHVHTRLTHSLETGQVGRSLARRLHAAVERDLPKTVAAEDIASIVRAACLAHDIGNPPFGHAGEEAMVHWFESNTDRFKSLSEEERIDLSAFDGNAQGFRVLTQIENFVFEGGMRLTYATLATFLKYPITPKPDTKKFSAFLSEAHILKEVADKVGLPMLDGQYSRHPLAYLVEAADDICYCVLDIEDAVELNIVSFEEALEVFRPLLSEDPHVIGQLAGPEMFRVNFARMRGAIFRRLIDGAIEAFMAQYSPIMEGRGPKDLFGSLDAGDLRRAFVNQAKQLGTSRIYRDAKKVEVELGSFATLDVLLTDLSDAAVECAGDPALSDGKLSWRSRAVLGLLGDHAPRAANSPRPAGWSPYQCLRRSVDFVSGMTDNYATYMAKQFRGMGFTGLQRP
jgi:dGTPase